VKCSKVYYIRSLIHTHKPFHINGPLPHPLDNIKEVLVTPLLFVSCVLVGIDEAYLFFNIYIYGTTFFLWKMAAESTQCS